MASGESTGRRPELPIGTVTFLFTDIEGSTRLLQALGERYEAVLADHLRILREELAAHHGVEVGTEGDGLFAVFASAVDAVSAAAAAQRALTAHPWPPDAAVRVRMGLHSGEGRLGGDDYLGIDVHRAARIAAAGHGGQVIVSEATAALARQRLPPGVTLREIGVHRLKDLEGPEVLFDLVIAGLRSEFPEIRSLDARQSNLPPERTSFVGREGELAELLALLEVERLVTLTGPGGTGKTRLALRVAATALPRFGDGALFVGLQEARDRARVASAIGQALELQEAADRPLEEVLRDALSARDLLLVLDNFEQVLEAAPLVDELLTAAPNMRVLVTSRTPLHLYGEQEYPVPALAVPAATTEPTGAGVLATFESVRLFVERARAAKPSFALDDESAAAVGDIVAHLDGLPLAIELAAARVKLLSPAAIRERLAQGLAMLESSAVGLAPRQRSLRAAIDWSYSLLADAEQRLCRRLAVFAGGADANAVAAVCDPDGSLGIDPFEGLASLVDKSLLRPLDTAGSEPRFGFLETIREFAAERLGEAGEADVISRRHAEYYLAIAEAAEPHLVGAEQRGWLDGLAVEHDNLRAALRWAVERRETETGMSLVAAVWRFWQIRGHLREGRVWAEELASAAPREPTQLRARFLTAHAGILYWLGDEAGPRAYYDEALAIFEALGDRRGIADTYHNMGFLEMRNDSHAAAAGLFDRSIALFRELGDAAGEASAIGASGYAHLLTGDYDEALPRIERAAELNRQLGQLSRLRDNLGALGQVCRLKGDLAAARRYLREALGMQRENPDVGRLVLDLSRMAALEVAEGRFERAVRIAAAAGSLRERLGGSVKTVLIVSGDPLAEARREMTEAEYREAAAAGEAMDLESIVEYAMTPIDALPSGG